MSASTGHQPDAAYFDVMADQATSHWWYRARRELLGQMLAQHGGSLPPGVVVDVGCGTGANASMLSAATGRTVVGTDLSEYALRHAPRGRAGGSRAMVTVAEALPVVTGAAAVLTSFDVLEHLDDDRLALLEYRRVLRPGGLLLLTVPAYQWLWSAHDEWAAHRRRYRIGELSSAVGGAGFDVLRATYYNSFLLPPAALLRRTPLRRLVRTVDDEVGASSPTVDRVMTSLARLERRVLERRSVPAGLSVLMVARRP